MKTSKVKFQSKKKKISRISTPKQTKHQQKQALPIGFLLRENTDTQQAKNQLRKASQEVENFQNVIQTRMSWNHEPEQRTHSWLDDISDTQVKGVILGKINGNSNSNMELKASLKPKITAALSYGQLKAKKRLELMGRYDILQKNGNLNKFSLYNPTFQQKIADYKRKFEKCKTSQSSQSLPNNYKTMQKIFKQQDKRNNYQSITALKHRHKIILVTPKMTHCSQPQTIKPTTNEGQLVSNICFKVPQFHKSSKKRSVTVHSENKMRQSLLLSNKKNFYLKKTNTICVLEKRMQSGNKCISLSNYKRKLEKEMQNEYSELMITQPKQNKNKLTKQTNNETKGSEYKIQEDEQSKIENQNRLSLQKAAKTMMLRQEFQRLRKLLKKQATYEFKIDEDSPIKIMKL